VSRPRSSTFRVQQRTAHNPQGSSVTNAGAAEGASALDDLASNRSCFAVDVSVNTPAVDRDPARFETDGGSDDGRKMLPSRGDTSPFAAKKHQPAHAAS
jgi:hypothetical protein